jgi:hypothetical protein
MPSGRHNVISHGFPDYLQARSGHTESVLWVRPIASSLQQASTVLVAGGGSTLNTAELYSIEPAPPVDRQ